MGHKCDFGNLYDEFHEVLPIRLALITPVPIAYQFKVIIHRLRPTSKDIVSWFLLNDGRVRLHTSMKSLQVTSFLSSLGVVAMATLDCCQVISTL